MMNSENRRVNWDLLADNPYMDVTTVDFALGDISGREFYLSAQEAGCGGEARNLIRPGVVRARQLARKALLRRGMLA